MQTIPMTDKEFRKKLDNIRERAFSKTLGDDNEASYTESLLESIRHMNEYGQEFWYARELQIALGYKQ